MSENVVLEKSYKFAIRIVKLYKYLTEEKEEFVIAKRVGHRILAEPSACQRVHG